MLIGIIRNKQDVRTIEIRTGWGGLRTPQRNVVTIQRKDNRFVSNGKSVSADQVKALVTALSAEPVTNPEMTNLGITPAWLKANLASQKPRAWAQATETTATQQQMFNKAFTDVAVIAKALPSLFTYTKFDDYPGTKVDVVFEDGKWVVEPQFDWGSSFSEVLLQSTESGTAVTSTGPANWCCNHLFRRAKRTARWSGEISLKGFLAGNSERSTGSLIRQEEW